MSGVWIVGTGLAGYTVARELRRLRPDAEITLVSRDGGEFYSKPTLSNAISAGSAPEQLVLQPAERMATQLRARILTHASVDSLDTSGKRLRVEGRWHDYDELVLALGADPIALPVPGLPPDALLHVNDLQDYRVLWNRLSGACRVAILGAGLIGCEFADDLARAGHEVHLFDIASHPLSRLVPREIGEALHAGLEKTGVTCHLGAAVERAEPDASAWRLFTATGASVVADVILCAAGLRPRIGLAQQAGLATARGIVVDRALRTSAPHVYALGDCAQVDGLLLPYVMPLMRSAKALARTLAGDVTPVAYPCMPVVAKTPSFPVVTAPIVDGSPFQWESAIEGGAYRAWCKTSDAQVRGFALGGEAVSERPQLERRMPSWLDAPPDPVGRAEAPAAS